MSHYAAYVKPGRMKRFVETESIKRYPVAEYQQVLTQASPFLASEYPRLIPNRPGHLIWADPRNVL